MSLTVATDTYISLEDATEYWDLQYDEVFPEGEEGEKLLKKATIAIDRLYGHRFIGFRNPDQPLEWPRTIWEQGNRFDETFGANLNLNGRSMETPVPREVAQATAEMAYLINNDQDVYAQPEASVSSESLQVSSISIDRTLTRGYQVNPLQPVFVVLQPVIKPSAGTLRLVK